MAVHDSFAVFIITLVTTVLLALILRRYAPYLNLMDTSGQEDRKHHQGKPAQVGGLAIIASVTTVLGVYYGSALPPSFWPIITGALLLAIMGSIDDARHIPALRKLFFQIVIVLIVILGFNLQLATAGDIFNFAKLPPYVGFLFSLFGFLVFINAFNFIDGLDGLAGGIAAVILLTMLIIAFQNHGATAGPIILIVGLLGSLCGFLSLNLRTPFRKKAIVFLGDAGSLSIGFMIAGLAIELANTSVWISEIPHPVIYAYILAYPLYDMMAVFIIRGFKNKSLFQADMTHLHFLLKKTGYADGRIALYLILLSCIYGGIGLLLWNFDMSDMISALLWVSLFAIHFLLYVFLHKKLSL